MDVYVGDAARLAIEGEHFIITFGDQKKRYRLTRHGVHILLADIKNALDQPAGGGAEIFYVPYTDMRNG